MTEEKLNLFQLTPGRVTKPCTSAANESRVGGIDLRHDWPFAQEFRQECARCHGKVNGSGFTGHVGISRTIDSDGGPLVVETGR
jgi:hypothetical protein